MDISLAHRNSSQWPRGMSFVIVRFWIERLLSDTHPFFNSAYARQSPAEQLFEQAVANARTCDVRGYLIFPCFQNMPPDRHLFSLFLPTNPDNDCDGWGFTFSGIFPSLALEIIYPAKHEKI